MEPQVSVIVPVYNGAPYLEEALESIFSQTLPPFEIIAINDGSTDDSLEILERNRSRISIINRENRGLPMTLNEGISLSRGNLLAFLDADDVWAADKLSRQVAFLSGHPDTEACFGMIRQFISPELPDEVKNTIMCPPGPQKGILKITLMLRRTAWERIGSFNETLKRGDFIDWFARAEEAGITYELLPDLLAYRRLHRSSMSSSYENDQDLISIVKAAMDRRRNAKVTTTK